MGTRGTKPLSVNAGRSTSRPRPDKAQAIQLRAQGHSLRFIGERLQVDAATVCRWMAEPEIRDEVQRVAREALPDLEADAQLARRYLRSVVEDDDAITKDKTKAAAVLLANYQRAQMIAVGNRAVDAVQQPKTYSPEEIRALERAAMEQLRIAPPEAVGAEVVGT